MRRAGGRAEPRPPLFKGRVARVADALEVSKDMVARALKADGIEART